MTNTKTVTVRSAIKLDSKSLAAITKFATKKLGHAVKPEVSLDPKLIAGFKLNLDGIEYDYSLSGSLEALAQEL